MRKKLFDTYKEELRDQRIKTKRTARAEEPKPGTAMLAKGGVVKGKRKGKR